MERVSVVRETFSERISARAWETSKPSAMAPPTVVALRKPRRVTSTGHLLICYGGMSRTTMLPSSQKCQREGRAGVPPAGEAASRRLTREADRTPQYPHTRESDRHASRA